MGARGFIDIFHRLGKIAFSVVIDIKALILRYVNANEVFIVVSINH